MSSPTSKQHHSTRALALWHDKDQGKYTTSQYLDRTFSAMVEYDGNHKPMVLVINEDRDALFQDILYLFGKQNDKYDPEEKDVMVVWGHGHPKNGAGLTVLENSNMIATLRLMKARNGVDFIATSKYDH